MPNLQACLRINHIGEVKGMIKNQYRPGGSIKEAKQPDPKNEVKKGLMH